MSWACDPVLVNTLVHTYEVSGTLLANTLRTFLAAQCALVGDQNWPADARGKIIQDPNYDFIIVGSGTAGSALANRLSEVPEWKVLLVEAGGNPILATEVPALFFKTLNTEVDWKYRSQPQNKSCRSYETKTCALPRGKVLGGSSCMTGLFYVRGNKMDYDQWAADGNDGWSYDDVLPYFMKSEDFTDFTGSIRQKNKYHNNRGYLGTQAGGNTSIIEQTILDAAKELGIKINEDYNGSNQMGISIAQTTIKEGLRQSMARSFLKPIKDRPNLHVLKNTLATKILFKPGTNEVAGIVANNNGTDLQINVKKELIVSAGAVNSPQLLMLSGIGPKAHLEEHNITLVADLPVGQNLQDHIFIPLYFKVKSSDDVNHLHTILPILEDFILNHKGFFANTSPDRVVVFANTTDTKAKRPDIQNHFLVLPVNESLTLDFDVIHGLSQEFITKFNEINKDYLIVVAAVIILHPKSRGEIKLKSDNPFDYPLIYTNYFHDAEDTATIIRGVRQTIKFVQTKALKSKGYELFWVDIDACKNMDKESDDFIQCMAEEVTFTLYHLVGSNKMGPDGDPTSVVTPELKVRGCTGLRVIDASIMPEIVSGNTNAATLMIGEKGADLIKNDWLN